MRLLAAVFPLLILAVLAPCTQAQEPERPLPKVVEHADPVYPALARQARISGDVVLRLSTDGQSVTSAEAETGHELLRQAAEQNVRTWKFAPHQPGVFRVTFRYELLARDVYIAFLPQPAIVVVAETPPALEINWSWVDRGTWKAELRSVHGGAERVVLQILNSGPEGHWLTGDITDTKGQKIELDDGHFDEERNMFWFKVSLSYPKGASRETFFVGRIKGDKLTGTFVDDTGETGTWTAVLEK